jgi:hypothetical protein
MSTGLNEVCRDNIGILIQWESNCIKNRIHNGPAGAFGAYRHSDLNVDQSSSNQIQIQ